MQTQHQQNNTTQRQTSPLWPVTKTTVLGFFSEMISAIFSEPVKLHIFKYEKIIEKILICHAWISFQLYRCPSGSGFEAWTFSDDQSPSSTCTSMNIDEPIPVGNSEIADELRCDSPPAPIGTKTSWKETSSQQKELMWCKMYLFDSICVSLLRNTQTLMQECGQRVKNKNQHAPGRNMLELG